MAKKLPPYSKSALQAKVPKVTQQKAAQAQLARQETSLKRQATTAKARVAAGPATKLTAEMVQQVLRQRLPGRYVEVAERSRTTRAKAQAAFDAAKKKQQTQAALKGLLAKAKK